MTILHIHMFMHMWLCVRATNFALMGLNANKQSAKVASNGNGKWLNVWQVYAKMYVCILTSIIYYCMVVCV